MTSMRRAVGDGFRRYASFRGRTSRPGFWWWMLLVLLAVPLAFIVSAPAAGLGGPVLLAVVAMPTLAVSVRRLHDTGRSGAWLLIGVALSVVFVGAALILATAALVVGVNPESFDTGAILLLLGLVAAWTPSLIMLSLRSDPGPNRFGEPDSGVRATAPPLGWDRER